jgi:tRNA (guanine26-N2/guanine27-N2)-dimethyltransferase
MYKEGKAVVYSTGAFVNEAARLTRDIGVAIAARYKDGDGGFSVLDATAATGIRGIRYCLEANASECTFLEINKTAYLTLKRNIAKNKLGNAKALNTSIQEFANSGQDSFDIIDLDPFGGVQPYVNDLMKLVRDGSLFFATSTDTAVLCGAHHGACVRLYGAIPMHNELCKEAGIRILIGSIAKAAATFNFGVEPLLSMVYKHYMRVHFRMKHGAENAMSSVKELGFMEYCNGCSHRGTQKGLIPRRLQCQDCGAQLQLSGPLWIGKLHDKGTMESVCTALSSNKDSILDRLRQEVDSPILYDVPKATRRLGMESVSPYKVIEELVQGGYAASAAHFDTSCIKTDVDIGIFVRAVRDAAGKAKKATSKKAPI